MPESILKILLTELQTVRIVCKGTKDKPCGVIAEMPIDKLRNAFGANAENLRCPFCGNEYSLRNERGEFVDPFKPFVNALMTLQRVSDRLDIQFVLSQSVSPHE